MNVNNFSGNLIGIIEIIILCIPESFNTNICEHKFKKWFCTQKPVWNVRWKISNKENKSDSKLYISGQRKHKRDAI